MNTAQCHICERQFEVPTTHAMHYVMIHQIPCRDCFNKLAHMIRQGP
jgi:hypothetical protein